ncbi:hypothetical protein D3C81_785160 [compost metagenome]
MHIPALSYTAYGHSWGMPGLLLGFNGEQRNGLLHGYALGNGHRFYSPVLMRFYSPDRLSPFEKGGLNAYCYCEGDPLNNSDPTGRVKTGLTAEFKRLKIPKVFKSGVKIYFKKNPDKTSYHLGIGEAGYSIDKAADGQYRVSNISGLGATLEQLQKTSALSAGLSAENAYLKAENSRLVNEVQTLEYRINELEEQRYLPKPLHPLPSSATSSPTPPPRPPKPASIRQPNE